ncbi:MAG: hypothetical protein ACYDEP_01295 [Acidimicrobiales bacterium]|nr:hypothetical protein [Actinomycetota bacterium]
MEEEAGWIETDDLDDGESRRRPPIVTVIAAVIAVAMIAGLIGSFLRVIL